jgi:hypothetical protein
MTAQPINDGWLENEAKALTMGNVSISTTNCLDTADDTFSYPTTYYYQVSEPVRPIRLTMAEVERLRKAAKADDALKTILKKFTQQIEVIVGFD